MSAPSVPAGWLRLNSLLNAFFSLFFFRSNTFFQTTIKLSDFYLEPKENLFLSLDKTPTDFLCDEDDHHQQTYDIPTWLHYQFDEDYLECGCCYTCFFYPCLEQKFKIDVSRDFTGLAFCCSKECEQKRVTVDFEVQDVGTVTISDAPAIMLMSTVLDKLAVHLDVDRNLLDFKFRYNGDDLDQETPLGWFERLNIQNRHILFKQPEVAPKKALAAPAQLPGERFLLGNRIPQLCLNDRIRSDVRKDLWAAIQAFIPHYLEADFYFAAPFDESKIFVCDKNLFVYPGAGTCKTDNPVGFEKQQKPFILFLLTKLFNSGSGSFVKELKLKDWSLRFELEVNHTSEILKKQPPTLYALCVSLPPSPNVWTNAPESMEIDEQVQEIVEDAPESMEIDEHVQEIVEDAPESMEIAEDAQEIVEDAPESMEIEEQVPEDAPEVVELVDNVLELEAFEDVGDEPEDIQFQCPEELDFQLIDDAAEAFLNEFRGEIPPNMDKMPQNLCFNSVICRAEGAKADYPRLTKHITGSSRPGINRANGLTFLKAALRFCRVYLDDSNPVAIYVPQPEGFILKDNQLLVTYQAGQFALNGDKSILVEWLFPLIDNTISLRDRRDSPFLQKLHKLVRENKPVLEHIESKLARPVLEYDDKAKILELVLNFENKESLGLFLTSEKIQVTELADGNCEIDFEAIPDASLKRLYKFLTDYPNYKAMDQKRGFADWPKLDDVQGQVEQNRDDGLIVLKNELRSSVGKHVETASPQDLAKRANFEEEYSMDPAVIEKGLKRKQAELGERDDSDELDESDEPIVSDEERKIVEEAQRELQRVTKPREDPELVEKYRLQHKAEEERQKKLAEQKEAFEAEEARRKAEFEAAQAARKAEFEANRKRLENSQRAADLKKKLEVQKERDAAKRSREVIEPIALTDNSAVEAEFESNFKRRAWRVHPAAQQHFHVERPEPNVRQ